MITIQVLAVLLCTLLLWTLIRDRNVMTLEARIIEGFLLFGMTMGAAGSLVIWWEMLTLFTITGYGAALFAGGTGMVLLALAIQNKLLCYGLLGVAHDVIQAYKGGPSLVVPEVRLGHHPMGDNGQPA